MATYKLHVSGDLYTADGWVSDVIRSVSVEADDRHQAELIALAEPSSQLWHGKFVPRFVQG